MLERLTVSEIPEIIDASMADLEGLLARARTCMTSDDYTLLKGLVDNQIILARLVRQRGTTIARLRRLFGLGSSEKTADVLGKNVAGSDSPGPGGSAGTPPAGEATAPTASGGDGPQPATATEGGSAKKAKGHGRVPVSAYLEAKHISVSHASLHPGDACPECAHGTLYLLKDPVRILRIVGQAPLVGVCWDCQSMRCSGCGKVFTARAPTEADGPKHDETAASMMALLRYGAGMPLNRLAHLQRALGTPVPASTQWDVAKERSEAVRPVFDELCRQAAQAKLVHNDDTHARILEFMGKRRAELLAAGKLPDPERTGLFTTAVVAVTSDGKHIALFSTGRKHAGENLGEVLRRRAADLPPPILMSDALDRNVPKGHAVVESNCLAHGRRNFVDEVDNFPRECRYLLEALGKVFKVDDHCRKQGLSPEERLLVHQRESGPVMDALGTWMTAQLEDKRIEPNSGMGQAITYLLKRWDKLTLFLRVADAPIENNICERALKMAIRHRNNSLFYRSQLGAQVGDIWMTLIHTAGLNGQNPYHYLTALQRHAKAVAASPADWLPWNYNATLAARAGPGADDSVPAAAAA